MTEAKKIVVWGSENILGSSIEVFLAAREDWHVVAISDKGDLDALILAVETHQPDIVIIPRDCHNELTHLPLQFLQDNPALRVIMVNLENNALEVYSQQKIMVEQAFDLITVIENGF